MKEVIDFLSELRYNNNREWFEANRGRYTLALEEFNSFAEQLLAGIGSFDPSVRNLTLKDITYRIYRDVRFSPNKEPYKTHMGVYVCPGGKKSGYAGYYFHVEPEGEGVLCTSMMTAGLYMPEAKVLKSVRDDMLVNGEKYTSFIKKAKGFSLYEGIKLRRTPTGYPAGGPYDEYLKLKDICLEKCFCNDYLLKPGLADRAIEDFAETYDFVKLLNISVKYAYEEM